MYCWCRGTWRTALSVKDAYDQKYQARSISSLKQKISEILLSFVYYWESSFQVLFRRRSDEMPPSPVYSWTICLASCIAARSGAEMSLNFGVLSQIELFATFVPLFQAEEKFNPSWMSLQIFLSPLLPLKSPVNQTLKWPFGYLGLGSFESCCYLTEA